MTYQNGEDGSETYNWKQNASSDKRMPSYLYRGNFPHVSSKMSVSRWDIISANLPYQLSFSQSYEKLSDSPIFCCSRIRNPIKNVRENLSIFSHIWKTIKLNSLTNCQFVRYCFLLKQQLASFFVLFKRLLLLSNLILYLIINLLPLKFCLAMDSSSTCYLLSVYK